MPTPSIADLRENYTQSGLSESDVLNDPIQQFRCWFDEALAADLPEPNAMTLSTVSAEGRPSSRIVLLKDLDEKGFVFYTNYNSRKGQELSIHPWASLVFVWLPLERQVRVEGRVEKVSDLETETYFHSRPRGSQLGAWVSRQSSVIRDRQALEQELKRLEEKYEGESIPRPPHWGGFRVYPEWIEFWQGRPNRLHDRICYESRTNQPWKISRLAP